MSSARLDLKRPYLVIPKLIEQPTWGGMYIAESKQWHQKEVLAGRKIGQSYELFSGSNLSLLNSSQDPDFEGELTDSGAVQQFTAPPDSVALSALLSSHAEDVLGKQKAASNGGELNLLIKFTQAMGNSFQVHIKDGATHPYWKPKPESWYYFEPGLITLGVKAQTDWEAYQNAVTALNEQITELSSRVKLGQMTYADVQVQIKQLTEQYNPWAFVNVVKIKKDQLVDLSGGGIHHSWEEDAVNLPLGNVLYELQAEAMDDVSTLRSFDKGKMAPDGSIRQLHIEDYFKLIDRAPESNKPGNHIATPELLESTDVYTLQRLLSTKYYSLEQLLLTGSGAVYETQINDYRHLFVKEGVVEVVTDSLTIEVSRGHSCFIPAAAWAYKIRSLDNNSQVLVSY